MLSASAVNLLLRILKLLRPPARLVQLLVGFQREAEVVFQVRAGEQEQRRDHDLVVLGRRCQQRIFEERLRQLDFGAKSKKR